MTDDPRPRLGPGFDTEAIPAVSEDPSGDGRRQLVLMIVGQILAALSLISWLVVALVTTVAVSTENTPGAWIFGALVWAYPIWPIGFSIAAWVYWRRGRSSWAAMLMALAFLPAALLLILVALSAI